MCVCVWGLASGTSSCYTKRMLGNGDGEKTVAIVSRFSLSGLIKENVPTSFPHPLRFSLIFMLIMFILSSLPFLSFWFDLVKPLLQSP